MRHEALNQKIPEIHFKPEGYVAGGDPEFLDGLLAKLQEQGLPTDRLLFSGFDGTQAAAGHPLPRHKAVFAMNEAGWRWKLQTREENPAVYAEGWDVPCIALYDGNQLAEVYSCDFNELNDVDARIEAKNVIKGEDIASLAPDKPIEELVVHKNYPEGSPTDTLVGLVYLK